MQMPFCNYGSMLDVVMEDPIPAVWCDPPEFAQGYLNMLGFQTKQAVTTGTPQDSRQEDDANPSLPQTISIPEPTPNVVTPTPQRRPPSSLRAPSPSPSLSSMASSTASSVHWQVLAQQVSADSSSSVDNENSLTKPMMKALQPYLPYSKRGESFWLQYSMVHDGASLELLLDKVQSTEYTILVVETTEGEVFGGFTTMPWKASQDYYGTGQSFLWKSVKNNPATTDVSIAEPMSETASRSSSRSSSPRRRSHRRSSRHKDKSSPIKVYSFAFLNHHVQLCRHNRLTLGGGGPDSQWGFGLQLEEDLLRGSSSPCWTFQSPSLSSSHADGSSFDVRNVEVWALTPCISIVEAERMQRKRRMRGGPLIQSALRTWAEQQPPLPY